MSGMDERPYYRVQSVQRAMHILKAFQPEHRAWGVTELSHHLGLSKSVVHRLLRTLEEDGFVQRDPEAGAYRLGLEAYRIGMVYLGQWNLPEDSARYLRTLMHELDMMAHLAVLDAGQVMYVNVVYPPRYAGGQEFSWAGRRQPPIRSALGKVLLAWMPRGWLDALLAGLTFEPLTCHTITDREVFKKHLQQVRQQGFAVDDREISLEWRCVAAPVFNHTRQVVAAISVSAALQQMPPDQVGHVASRVTQAALRLSEQLGYR
jgi:IclR family transcriptional regulator, KDG regulon repressor